MSEFEGPKKILRESIPIGDLEVFFQSQILKRVPNSTIETGLIEGWLKQARKRSQEKHSELWNDWKSSRKNSYAPHLAEEMLKEVNYDWISRKSRRLGAAVDLNWEEIAPSFEDWLTEEPS